MFYVLPQTHAVHGSRVFEATSQSAERSAPTYTRGRVRLPVESVLHAHARDGVLALQLVAWVTLKCHAVTGLLAVPVSRPVHRDAGVIAGCCCSGWKCRSESRTQRYWQTVRQRGNNIVPGSWARCRRATNKLFLTGSWRHMKPQPGRIVGD